MTTASATVIGNVCVLNCGRKPRTRAASSNRQRASGLAASAIAPPSCGRSPASVCSNSVLPAPLAPSTHQTSPAPHGERNRVDQRASADADAKRLDFEQRRSVAHRPPLRNNNAMNTGAPITAVTAPTGSC